MRVAVLNLLCISQLICMACGAKLANIESSIDKDEKVKTHIESRQPKFLFGVSIFRNSFYIRNLGYYLLRRFCPKISNSSLILSKLQVYHTYVSTLQTTTTSTTTLTTSTLCYTTAGTVNTACTRKKRSIWDAPIEGNQVFTLSPNGCYITTHLLLKAL